jgi:hypothetical protein
MNILQSSWNYLLFNMEYLKGYLFDGKEYRSKLEFHAFCCAMQVDKKYK